MKKILIVFVLFCAFFKMFAEDDEKLRLAVMEFEDRSGTLSKQLLSDATEYLRSALTSANKYTVIAKERQEQAMIKEMKKESYKECNDKNCQIPLGQALSADTILRTTITRLGKTFIIASELIDLAKEATIVGAREKYDGSEESLSTALDNIAEKVIHAYDSAMNKEQSEIGEKSETDRKITAARLKDDGKMYRDAGISVLVIGTTAGVLLTGLSFIAMDENPNNEGIYDKPTTTSKTMLSIGIILTVGSIAGGTYLVVKGRKMQREGEYLELNNVSVLPTKGGAYALVGFSF